MPFQNKSCRHPLLQHVRDVSFRLHEDVSKPPIARNLPHSSPPTRQSFRLPNRPSTAFSHQPTHLANKSPPAEINNRDNCLTKVDMSTTAPHSSTSYPRPPPLPLPFPTHHSSTCQPLVVPPAPLPCPTPQAPHNNSAHLHRLHPPNPINRTDRTKVRSPPAININTPTKTSTTTTNTTRSDTNYK